MSDHYGTGGKLSTGEILRKITGGDPPVEGIPEAIGTSEDFPLTTRPGEYMGQPREPLLLPTLIVMPPTPLEIAIAELTLIETKLRKFADEQGTVAILRRAEDVALVRKALEAL